MEGNKKLLTVPSITKMQHAFCPMAPHGSNLHVTHTYKDLMEESMLEWGIEYDESIQQILEWGLEHDGRIPTYLHRLLLIPV